MLIDAGTILGLSESVGTLAMGAPAESEVLAAPGWMALTPFTPLLGVVTCIIAAMSPNLRKTRFPAFATVGSIALGFVLSVITFLSVGDTTQIAHAWDWIHLSWGTDEGETLVANFGFYLDGLSILWMLFVTGLGALIALYASEYMEHDLGLGYCRFFGAFSLFVFSMLALVMADNLILLYLGWEGVGLCSYLLIGYFYKKPSAVAAAKKAFIVNRIGDLGLALGIFLIYVQFGTVEYAKLFDPDNSELMYWFKAALDGEFGEAPAIMQAIAGLLMIGAFGKSAQFPLYVWLPDAMEGPTPVSALIHAATMVTAGVFLIARMFPVFAISEWALPVVAWIGVITALLAATIGMAQFDIKRIMAYSTVSQLGYMFAGLGALTTVGAASHVFTHAFFKAALFLCCGAVMHGMAGQLDLRKISGLWGMKGWGITSFAMLIGCLNLAGFPLLAGYFSKDMIIAEMFVTPHYGFTLLGWVLLITAGLTAYYTFRVFFRVFVGPEHAEPGDEHHDDGHADHGEDGHDDHGFHPHPPGKRINFVLATLVVLSFGAIPLMLVGDHHGWVGGMVHNSSGHFETPYSSHADHGAEGGHGEELAPMEHDEHALAGNTFFGFDPHVAMYFVSGAFGLVGILVAAYLHGPKGAWGLGLGSRSEAARSRADDLTITRTAVARWARNKWYVDEFYDFVFRIPLHVLSQVFYFIDRWIVDGLVNLFGFLPRMLAHSVRPSQSGLIHGYALGTAGGVAVLLMIVWVVSVFS